MLMQINQCYKWRVCDKLNVMKCYVFQVWLWESYGMGPQGLGRVHLGVCSQVYLHLLYLECNYLEHSRVYKWVKLEPHGIKPLKLQNLWNIYCLICILRASLDDKNYTKEDGIGWLASHRLTLGFVQTDWKFARASRPFPNGSIWLIIS